MDAAKLPDELQSGFLRVGEVAQPRMEEQDGCEAQTDRSSVTFLSGPSYCTKVTFWRLPCLCGPSSSTEHEERCPGLCGAEQVMPRWAKAAAGGGPEGWGEQTALSAACSHAPDPRGHANAPVSTRVPAPMLRRWFLDTSKTFRSILASLACSSSSSALCSVLSCLATLLRKLVPWNKLVMRQAYQHLLSFTLHTEPQVQKAARCGISSVLFEVMSPASRRAVRVTVKFCAQEISRAGGTREAMAILDVLTLLHDLLPCLPRATMSLYCETLLHVMSLGQMLVMKSTMQIFHCLFSAQSSHTCLPVELNAQIIEALYDYLPSESNLQPTVTWLDVMERAHIHLGRLQMELCWKHLPRLFAATMTLFLLPHPQVPSAAAETLKMLLNKCVVPHMANLGPISTSASGPAASLCEMFRAVEDGLTYRYRKVRAPVLQVLQVFFKACGKQGHPIMRKCLKTLCRLRLSLDFPDVTEPDKAVGAAVSALGPEVLLEAVPLAIKSREEILDFSRSWLLPVLQDHIRSARLGFSIHYFLPLAAALKGRATELARDRMKLKSEIYKELEGQVWSLLPVFCRCPTDVVNSFSRLAHALGTTLSERPDLRLTVCHALCTLITRGCQTAAERAEVSHFAKYFLPILFIMYRQPDSNRAHQHTVLDTIRTYLTITHRQVRGARPGQPRAHPLPHRLSNLDLIMAMVPYADEPTLSTLYHTIQRFLHRVRVPTLGSLGKERGWGPPGSGQEALGLDRFVILCTKVLGLCENAAMLLVKMGQAFLCFGPTPQGSCALFPPGLKGSVSMIKCTVLVLTRLLFNFKGEAGLLGHGGWGPGRCRARDPMAGADLGGGRSWSELDPYAYCTFNRSMLNRRYSTDAYLGGGLAHGCGEGSQGPWQDPGWVPASLDPRAVLVTRLCLVAGTSATGSTLDTPPPPLGKARNCPHGQLLPHHPPTPNTGLPQIALTCTSSFSRRKAKMQGRFKGLMKGAQHGIQAGRRRHLTCEVRPAGPLPPTRCAALGVVAPGLDLCSVPQGVARAWVFVRPGLRGQSSKYDSTRTDGSLVVLPAPEPLPSETRRLRRAQRKGRDRLHVQGILMVFPLGSPSTGVQSRLRCFRISLPRSAPGPQRAAGAPGPGRGSTAQSRGAGRARQGHLQAQPCRRQDQPCPNQPRETRVQPPRHTTHPQTPASPAPGKQGAAATHAPLLPGGQGCTKTPGQRKATPQCGPV
uniref:RRP12-like protein n=1 Tax=Crocodylus porosus TaxID=8502 RepID=A0A7M4EVW9_CROPO